MKHNINKYLEDILISIADIEGYCKSVTNYIDIENNQMLFDALCRRFAIIGEALYQADKINPQLNITNKNKIKGLRHIIVHDYDRVLPEDLFIIIQTKLTNLKNEVEIIINSNS